MSQADQTQYSVFLLEEDPAAVVLARQACESNTPPIKLHLVQNSDEAMAWMSSLSAKNLPNLLLLDLNLPKLSGLAVMRRLRMHELTRELPIVVFSAVHESFEVQQSYQVGANSFVEKPTTVGEFRELFSTQIKYWLSRVNP